MSRSVDDLIGQILNPPVAAQPPVHRSPVPPAEPLSVLIGRILGPPSPPPERVSEPQAAAEIEDAAAEVRDVA
jgi:hypothetical protein